MDEKTHAHSSFRTHAPTHAPTHTASLLNAQQRQGIVTAHAVSANISFLLVKMSSSTTTEVMPSPPSSVSTTDYDVIKLIDSVKSFRLLYDTSMRDHSDQQLVRSAWLTLTEKVGLQRTEANMKVLKSRWKALRGSFLRLAKTLPPSGFDAGFKRRKCEAWEYWTAMEWLSDYIDIAGSTRSSNSSSTAEERVSSLQSRGNVDNIVTNDSVLEEDKENDFAVDSDSQTLTDTPSSRQSRIEELQMSLRKRKQSGDPIGTAILTHLQQRQERRLTEEEAFGEYVSTSLSNLNDVNQREIAKFKIGMFAFHSFKNLALSFLNFFLQILNKLVASEFTYVNAVQVAYSEKRLPI